MRSRTGRTRNDPHTQTGTDGLTNTRARIVGARTGILADSLVGLVRLITLAGSAVGRIVTRLSNVITPLGWVVLALIPVSLIVGYTFGWNEFVAVGWASLALAVFASAVLVGSPSYGMELTLPHRRSVVGDSAVGHVRVRNVGRWRILGSILEVPVGDGLVQLALPGLRKGAEQSVDFRIPTDKRGVVPVGPAYTLRADPLSLVRREITWSSRHELIVHPQTVSVPATSTGLIRDLEGVPTRDLTSSDVAFHALREYQSGDDRRYIHWRSTAKTGTYMVRQFEQTRRSHLLIAMSLATQDFAGEAEFELAVSVVGSLGVRAIRDGRTISVAVSAVTPEFAKRTVFAVRNLAVHLPERLLDDLAVVTHSESALRMVDMARVLAESAAGVSVAFLVCGSRTTAPQLRGAAALFPAGVAVVAVMCDPEAEPGLRRVGTIDVLTIGYIDELRIALARAAAVS